MRGRRDRNKDGGKTTTIQGGKRFFGKKKGEESSVQIGDDAVTTGRRLERLERLGTMEEMQR